MPAQAVVTSDGVELHTESAGRGNAILFVHEYAGDHRSWEPQVRRLSRSHRCITYAARGYPPSQVPADAGAYSQQHAVDDAVAVLDGLGVETADVVGISMGGFAGLHLAMRHPARVRSLVVLGTGYGARPEEAARFRGECEAIARLIDESGMKSFARRYLSGPARVQFQNKDPRGWKQLMRELGEHAADGAVRTMLGVQRQRAVSVRAEGGAVGDRCAGADLGGRRGRRLSRDQPVAEARHSPERSGRPAEVGPYAQPRGARPRERVHRRLPGTGRGRAWGPRDPRATPGAITGIS